MIGIKKLNFGYGQESLFQDANLFLKPGKIYGLLGLNGAGKSTLLSLIAGLLFPRSGEMSVLNFEPAKRTPNFLSKLFVLAENVVVPNVTDQEYITMISPFYPKFDHQQIDRLLTEFDVPRGRNLAKLSHGQQKKFLLSFGLSCNAELLMLDEPTNGLDIPSKGLFRRLVAESLSDEQIIIASTHQVRDIESLIDAIIILHQGQMLFNRGVDEITENLRMSFSNIRPQPNNDLLYTEQTVGGYSSVWLDKNATQGQLDLELLFKAVVNSPAKYTQLFSSEEI